MNIAHIAYSMEVGGAEKIIALLCQLQRQQGHHPSVHCLYENGPVATPLVHEGFEVTLHRLPSRIGIMRSLYQSFARNTPDVVHCHNATAAIFGSLPARMAGVKKVVVTRHGLVDPPYLFKRELQFAAATRLCDWVIAVCDGARKNLVSAPFASRRKIVRIYNGGLPVTPNGAMPVSKTGFTLLHVGRLAPVKNQESLLRAFALARSSVPDLQLWIVGDGPLRSKLQQLSEELGIQPATQFLGEQTDVAPFYLGADLFVMSSLSEGLPMSLLEAMSAGLPSIVTDVGGMAEVACLSESAVSVPASDHEALAAAIRNAAEGRADLSRRGNAARECYERHFTLIRMANDYMHLYS